MEPRPGLTVQELLNTITPRAWVTPTIAVGLVGCFIASVVFGVSATQPTSQQLLQVGADYGPLVAEGQWWRLLSATVLHAGVIHLAFNLWAFWNGGQFAERLFGNLSFLALYVFSAVGGELASLLWNPTVVGVGASGAVFGVFGALLAFMVFHQGVLPPEFLRAQRSSLLGFIGYNIVFSFLQPQINLAAHAGGLATGFLCGAMLGRDLLRPHDDALGRLLRAVALALMLALGAVAVQKRLAAVPDIKASQLASQAYDAVTARQLDQAIALYTQALELRPEDTWLINRGLAEAEAGDFARALADVRAANAHDPTELSRAMLCQLSVKSELDWPRAQADCDAAIAADPKNADTMSSRAVAHLEQDHGELALADADAALALEPDHPGALSLRVGLRLDRHDLKGADRDCQALLTKAKPAAMTLRLCARVARVSHDGPRALELLDRAVKTEPSDPQSLVERAAVHQANGHDELALADYAQALALQPELANARNNRGWLRVQRGEFAEALTDADQAVEREPNDAAFAGTHCFALAGLGQLDEALAECRRAVKLEGDTAQPIDAGMLAWLEHRPDDARRFWAQAKADSPDDARAFEPYLKKLGVR